MTTSIMPIASFFALPPDSSWLYIGIFLSLLVGFGMFWLISQVPTNMRKYVIGGFTFIAGFIFVAQYLWPVPLGADFNTQEPSNVTESVGFFLGQAIAPVAQIVNVIAGFLLGLGIYSLLRVHVSRITRRTKDWWFSLLLVSSLVVMFVVGILDWRAREFIAEPGALEFRESWWAINYLNDVLFIGLYQQMDAAMFSMIAFFILSAAFRAFRVRSIEATVMMVSGLILMLNLMGLITAGWESGVNNLVESTGNGFYSNLNLNDVANWIRSNMQIPAIRAIEFGVGLGALAMGLRLWLGLERGGVSA